MTEFGRRWCDSLSSRAQGAEAALAGTYYDAEWVYLRMASYTGDAGWERCAEAAESVYRDSYVVPAGGAVPGYWNFSDGLAEDYVRSGDAASKEAVLLLRDNASFSPPSTERSATKSFEVSREVAYAIESHLNAEKVGEPRSARVRALVDDALGHVDQWFDSRSSGYVRSFMVGLTAQALVRWHQATGDGRVVPALRTALDGLWERTWDAGEAAFRYQDVATSDGGTEPSPDVSLLIAPAYEYLFRQTGEARFRERGDAAFDGGVKAAWLSNAKQFNQSYRWSFDYVEWRGR